MITDNDLIKAAFEKWYRTTDGVMANSLDKSFESVANSNFKAGYQAALAQQAKQEPATINIYYMNDNHTFERLTLDVEESLLKIKVQWDKGYTYGMLCFGDNKPKGLDVVHAHGKAKWAEFEKEVREVYKSIGDTSPPNQDAEIAELKARVKEVEKQLDARQNWNSPLDIIGFIYE